MHRSEEKSCIFTNHEPSPWGDSAIRIGVTNTMTYYIGHILVDESLQVGDMIEAGDEIGTYGNTPAIDFGVLNLNVNNAFISNKYQINTIYGDKPLSYYVEPLRTQLYALVKPADSGYTGGVTDGRFVYDVPGTLCGNWFQEGCLDSVMWYENEDTLTFAYDNFYPDQIRIGIGKNLIHNLFALKNEDNPVKPEDVTTASGAVAYYLYDARNTGAGRLPGGERIGLMIVQMLSDTRLKLEIFFDPALEDAEFTAAAWYYVRDPVPKR